MRNVLFIFPSFARTCLKCNPENDEKRTPRGRACHTWATRLPPAGRWRVGEPKHGIQKNPAWAYAQRRKGPRPSERKGAQPKRGAEGKNPGEGSGRRSPRGGGATHPAPKGQLPQAASRDSAGRRRWPKGPQQNCAAELRREGPRDAPPDPRGYVHLRTLEEPATRRRE